MKQKTRFFLSLALVAAFILALPAQARAAAKRTRFAYVKIDDSEAYAGGTFQNYFRYPKLKGSKAAIKKINKALEKEGKAFIKMSGYTKDDIAQFIEHDYENYHNRCEYFNTADGKAAFNDGRLFSICYQTAWYAGGVSNYDIFGVTFNVKTGKRLNLFQVLPEEDANYSELRATIHEKLLKKYDSEVAGAFYQNYDSKKKLQKADFYINTKGKVVVCFRTYDLSYGAAGCLTVTLP